MWTMSCVPEQFSFALGPFTFTAPATVMVGAKSGSHANLRYDLCSTSVSLSYVGEAPQGTSLQDRVSHEVFTIQMEDGNVLKCFSANAHLPTFLSNEDSMEIQFYGMVGEGYFSSLHYLNVKITGKSKVIMPNKLSVHRMMFDRNLGNFRPQKVGDFPVDGARNKIIQLCVGDESEHFLWGCPGEVQCTLWNIKHSFVSVRDTIPDGTPIVSEAELQILMQCMLIMVVSDTIDFQAYAELVGQQYIDIQKLVKDFSTIVPLRTLFEFYATMKPTSSVAQITGGVAHFVSLVLKPEEIAPALAVPSVRQIVTSVDLRSPQTTLRNLILGLNDLKTSASGEARMVVVNSVDDAFSRDLTRYLHMASSMVNVKDSFYIESKHGHDVICMVGKHFHVMTQYAIRHLLREHARRHRESVRKRTVTFANIVDGKIEKITSHYDQLLKSHVEEHGRDGDLKKAVAQARKAGITVSLTPPDKTPQAKGLVVLNAVQKNAVIAEVVHPTIELPPEPQPEPAPSARPEFKSTVHSCVQDILPELKEGRKLKLWERGQERRWTLAVLKDDNILVSCMPGYGRLPKATLNVVLDETKRHVIGVFTKGKRKFAPQVWAKPFTSKDVIPSAAIHVYDPNGNILIGREPEGKTHAGKWTLPCGKIEPDENVAQCIQRELHEEANLKTSASSLKRLEDANGSPIAHVDLLNGKTYVTHMFSLRKEDTFRDEGKPSTDLLSELHYERPDAIPVLLKEGIGRHCLTYVAGDREMVSEIADNLRLEQPEPEPEPQLEPEPELQSEVKRRSSLSSNASSASWASSTPQREAKKALKQVRADFCKGPVAYLENKFYFGEDVELAKDEGGTVIEVGTAVNNGANQKSVGGTFSVGGEGNGIAFELIQKSGELTAVAVSEIHSVKPPRDLVLTATTSQDAGPAHLYNIKTLVLEYSDGLSAAMVSASGMPHFWHVMGLLLVRFFRLQLNVVLLDDDAKRTEIVENWAPEVKLKKQVLTFGSDTSDA
jgi:8-oxo-dGTP pyrophosphatase MutT (NUDIX family)